MYRAVKLLIALSAPLFLLACGSTLAQRLEEKKSEFATLPPEDQQAVKAGVIKVGYTRDMVYVALGRPSSATIAADTETWEYRNYFPTEVVAGSVPAPKAGAMAGHQSPSLTGWDSTRLPSEGSASGELLNSANPGPTPQGQAWAGGSSTTLHVFFQQGKVSGFKIER